MDTSCIDESTSESISMTPTTKTILLAAPAPAPAPNKLCRVGSGTSSVVLDSESGVEAESRKLPSSQYKGVVPQPNGRWGAQIYEKHQRVWLGTFNEEQEAAKAYDVAAQRFRGRDAITNFKPLSESEKDDIETAFLNSHSKAEIVDMLRKHTYNDELQQSKRNIGGGDDAECRRSRRGSSDTAEKEFDHLFDKAVTPSDVGKLNRLVIPKQHAEKHFPLQIVSNCKGVLLNFEDNGGKVWRFRYSYWNSSQSYVLTKGWSRFVKEKGLKAGDTISFLRSKGGDKQLYIDWKPRTGLGSLLLQENHMFYQINPLNPVQPVQVFRLFGVNIFKIPVAVASVVDCSSSSSSWNANGKRGREMELECCKKQCIAGGAL